jgi:hypothetical protein
VGKVYLRFKTNFKKQIPDQFLALFPPKVKLETENILLKTIAASVLLAY